MGNVFSLKESGILPLRIEEKNQPAAGSCAYREDYPKILRGRRNVSILAAGAGRKYCHTHKINKGTDFPPLRVAKLLALTPEHHISSSKRYSGFGFYTEMAPLYPDDLSVLSQSRCLAERRDRALSKHRAPPERAPRLETIRI